MQATPEGPHPWYGPCDEFDDGNACSECRYRREALAADKAALAAVFASLTNSPAAKPAVESRGVTAAGVAGASPAFSDDDDAPISLVPTEFAGRAFARDVAVAAPEVAGTARHLLDPAKVAAQVWTAIDRALVQMTVAERARVLQYVHVIEAERGE